MEIFLTFLDIPHYSTQEFPLWNRASLVLCCYCTVLNCEYCNEVELQNTMSSVLFCAVHNTQYKYSTVVEMRKNNTSVQY